MRIATSSGLAALLVASIAAACERTRAGQPASASLASQAQLEPNETAGTPDAGADSSQRVSELERELAGARAELEGARDGARDGDCAELAAEVASLRGELAAHEAQRVARELEWQRYMDTLRSLDLSVLPGGFEAQPPPEQGPPAAPATAPEVDVELARRSEAIERSLRALLAIEGVRGIDLFEAGTLHDEPGGGWIGPVVFRKLDERGRLAGSLCAERLRLEASRAARTLTVVLEDGFESRDGERLEFPLDAGDALAMSPIGVRRFVLADLDPLPWVQAAPELFSAREVDQPLDDGRWNLEYVRLTLNQLLREDAGQGYWRVKSLAGVHGSLLREVHLENFDAQGKLERRAFADRMFIEAQERGVLLQLEQGSIERGDERAPFLDGRFRLFLPRADLDAWRKAEIPGLSPPPAARERPRSD